MRLSWRVVRVVLVALVLGFLASRLIDEVRGANATKLQRESFLAGLIDESY